MEHSRLALLAMIAALVGCAPTAAPAPVVAAPTPKAYACSFERQARVQYEALPTGSALRTMIDDYGIERDELRAALGLPKPTPCPSAPPS
jgi:hypothetical protein